VQLAPIQQGITNTLKFPLESTDGTVTLYMRGAGGRFSYVLTDGLDGTYSVELSPQQANLMKEGGYQYAVRVLDGTTTAQLLSGDITVLEDVFSKGGVLDTRNKYRIALDAIDATLSKTADDNQYRFTIDGTELWRYTIDDLLKLRQTYARLCRDEDNKKRGKSIFGQTLQYREGYSKVLNPEPYSGGYLV
jgi:hypothetical protein